MEAFVVHPDVLGVFEHYTLGNARQEFLKHREMSLTKL